MLNGPKNAGFDQAAVWNYMIDESLRVAALLPGLKSPNPEVRIIALHTYASCFDHFGIEHNAPLEEVALLTTAAEREVRESARQTLARIRNRRSLQPVFELLIEALKACNDMEEGLDFGRILGCAYSSQWASAFPVSALSALLEHESEIAKAAGARASIAYVSSARQGLHQMAEMLGLAEREHVYLLSGQELIDRAAPSPDLDKWDIDLTKRQEALSTANTLLPLLATLLKSGRREVRLEAARAIGEYAADCAPIVNEIIPLSLDGDPQVREAVFSALGCCALSFNDDQIFVQLMDRETHVAPMFSLVTALGRLPRASFEAIRRIKILSALEPQESSAMLGKMGFLVLDNEILASHAREALRLIEARIGSS